MADQPLVDAQHLKRGCRDQSGANSAGKSATDAIRMSASSERLCRVPVPDSTPTAAPAPAAAPGTITYRVTGNRELIDLVTVIYTDQQGALQTELNVALPWSKTVVLDPGVTLSSVTATSVRGQLNCSITDAGGNLIASQNSNSIITNCTR